MMTLHALLLCALAVPAGAANTKVDVTPVKGDAGYRGNPTQGYGGSSGVVSPSLNAAPAGSGVFGGGVNAAPQVRPDGSGGVNAAAAGAGASIVAPGAQTQGARVQAQPVAPGVEAAGRTHSQITQEAAALSAPRVGAAQRAALDPTGAGVKNAALTGRGQLDKAAGAIGISRGAEAAGADGAVAGSLDKIFDDAKRSGGGPAAAVKGGFAGLARQVKQLVSVGNNAAPKDAPRLYGEAIAAAEKGLPAPAAAAVREAVLSSAREKARLSLSEVVNAGYRAAVSGDAKGVAEQLGGLKRWEALLGQPGRPLISNGDRVAGDIQRVLSEGAAGKEAPRVFFRPAGAEGQLEAVLPLSSVAKLAAAPVLPLSLDGAAALRGSPDEVLREQAALFRASPGPASGARLLYQAYRKMGASAPRAVLAATGFALRSFWRWLLDLAAEGVSRLTGRGPARGGWTLEPGPADPAALKPFALYGEVAAAQSAAARRMSWHSGSWARDAETLELARRAGRAHEALTGDAAGRFVVDRLVAEAEAARTLDEASAARLADWLGRLQGDALRATLTRRLTVASDRKAGSWLAAGSGSAEGALSSLAARVRAEGSVVLDGPRLWGRWSQGDSHLKAFADLRPAEEGGRLVLLLQSPAAETASERLAALGMSVERRGRRLRAVLDGESASFSADALESALLDAVSVSFGGEAEGEAGPAGAALDELAGRLLEPAALEAAASLRAADPSPLDFRPVGEVDGMPAERSVRRSGRGVLTLTVLRDPATGEPARAAAELDGKALAPAALGRALRAGQ